MKSLTKLMGALGRQGGGKGIRDRRDMGFRVAELLIHMSYFDFSSARLAALHLSRFHPTNVDTVTRHARKVKESEASSRYSVVICFFIYHPNLYSIIGCETSSIGHPRPPIRGFALMIQRTRDVFEHETLSLLRPR